MIDSIKNIPDVSFIDNLSLEELQNQMISDYLAKLSEITGKEQELSLASPYRMILYAITLQHYQMYQYIEHAGKMNLIKYAVGDFLDHIAALRGIKREDGACALTTLRFGIEDVMESVITIPKGTRVSGNGITFRTVEAAEIKPGERYVDIGACCTESGSKGNGYLPGEISQLIDALPYVDTAANTKETSGGADVESDEHLTERVYLAPAGYSVAGPEDAYIYFVKESNPLITDVRVTSPNPAEVVIRFIIGNGQIPDENVIAAVQKYISAKDKRPLTDKVQVVAPEKHNYKISVKYWIDANQEAVETAIRKQVEDAVTAYIAWQNSKIGKDIDPSYLIHLMVQAGARRVEVTEPVYAAVDSDSVPQATETKITYGGVEDD